MVQTADGSPEEGAGRKDDDMSNPMWVHILRLLDDEEQATMVHQIFKQAMITRAIETDLTDRDRAEHVGRTSDLVAAELAEPDSLTAPGFWLVRAGRPLLHLSGSVFAYTYKMLASAALQRRILATSWHRCTG